MLEWQCVLLAHWNKGLVGGLDGGVGEQGSWSEEVVGGRRGGKLVGLRQEERSLLLGLRLDVWLVLDLQHPLLMQHLLQHAAAFSWATGAL